MDQGFWISERYVSRISILHLETILFDRDICLLHFYFINSGLPAYVPRVNASSINKKRKFSERSAYRHEMAGLFCIVFPVLSIGGCKTYPPLNPDEKYLAHDYLIGPGDNVDIIVWRNPEVSMAVPVRPDGKITTPLVEDLPASGKTSTQLARDIEEALSKYIQQPVVTVIVTEFVGPYTEQIRVIGEAARPQALPYREEMTLMDVLIAVAV